MCCDNKKPRCERPDSLKGKRPDRCTPKQIKECHGTDENHPCVRTKKEEQK